MNAGIFKSAHFRYTICGTDRSTALKCPSCQNEMSIDPADPSKVVCYTCRKRYPANKVEQYWVEKERLDNNRVKVGEEAHAAKGIFNSAQPNQPTPTAPQSQASAPRYGTPYVPQEVQNTPSVPTTSSVYQSSYQPNQATQQAQTQPQPVYPQTYQQPIPYQQPATYQQPVYPQAQPYQQPIYPQGQPYPQAYPQAYVPPANPYQNDPISKKARGLGIAALCCGIAGLIILPLLVGGTGLGLGIGSLAISSKNARPKSGMAIAGVIIGGIAVVIGVLQLISGYFFGYYY